MGNLGACLESSPVLPGDDAAGSALSEPQQYLTFMLGEKIFATSIYSIKEIIEYGQVTEVPRMPSFVLGVINLRGVVVPLIDLGARFGKPPGEVTRSTRIVIFEVASGDDAETLLGVKVDAVNAVLEIPAADIKPAPAFGTDIGTDFICGMGRIDEHFIVILNIDHVLSMDEMTTLVDLV